jgi:RNA polymerase sigma-70 factor, ECF subfamily
MSAPYEPIQVCSATTIAFDGASQDQRELIPLSTRSDAALLVEYAESGNREAFEELVRRHERKLFNYLHKYIGDAQLAEDAFQATFLQVHLKCRQFDRDRALAPWLYQIATNQATDLLRRNRRYRAFSLNAALCSNGRGKKDASLLNFLTNADAGPSDRAEASEDGQRIWSSMEKLPQRLKEVLVLLTYQGLKCREVAAKLGIPIGTVKSRAHEAVQRLHRILVAAATTANKNAQGTSPLHKVSA